MLSNHMQGVNGAPPRHVSIPPGMHMMPASSVEPESPGSHGGTKRRRKTGDDGGIGPLGPAEPRRLRRSHEACARCRGKKIKCDSKHPRCTACQTAGVECEQEDRHRQTLTPRGYTERIELQLAQCDALLKRHLPGFDLNNIEEFLVRDGIELPPQPETGSFGFGPSPLRQAFRPGEPPMPPTPGKAGPPPPGPYMYPPPGMMPPPPGYPPHGMMPYPPGGPYQMPPPMPPPGSYNPSIHPAFQPGMPHYTPPPQPTTPTAVPAPPHAAPSPHEVVRSLPDIKGQDPNSNDMSTTQSLAKNFGVSPSIVNEIKLTSSAHGDKEDLAVGANGLSSGRDSVVAEIEPPRYPQNWRKVSIRRPSITAQHLSITARPEPVAVWLPKDRNLVQHIVDVYFQRLNIHRPVFFKSDFQQMLDDLYSDRATHDPGFICSLYLALALGTLSEISHRSSEMDSDDMSVSSPSSQSANSGMPPEWPDHDEFFRRALGVKPDLKVTISSLQALILLHFYLYTERQGRTLWRLVGSLVRLSIELGLHHDPTTQVNPVNDQPLFSDKECQLRIRLWGIVLVHDRGTSILLGRPLAITPSDANTPQPSRVSSASRLKGLREEFSEHFDLSHPIADIQGDIIISLYSPTRQNGDTIMRNATRIIKSMLEFRLRLPERYQYYFSGTDEWPMEKKSNLVQNITEDEGLTLLKFGICRILLLRALFSSRELTFPQRRKALVDAIVTSHNMIIVHSQLIRFPDIAFFTSPIPLHIAAMVILYGHMSKTETLPVHTAIEDVWLALDMLPRFRWRWERKDVNGGHPLISKLAEHVLGVSLHTVGPATNPVLLTELDWDDENTSHLKSPQSTPTLSTASYNSATTYGRATGKTPPERNAPMPDCQHMFYPFYPEAQVNGQSPEGGAESSHGSNYSHLLAAAATAPGQDSYMSEERDGSAPEMQSSHQPMWVQHQHQHQHQHQQAASVRY